MRANIYITIDSTSTRATEKQYGYVLECMVARAAKTKEGFGKITGTYHHAVLTALVEALERFHQPCSIRVHTEDAYVLNMLEHNLDRWGQNGFLTSKGRPIADREKWLRIQELLKAHDFCTSPGKHPYTGWLQEEMRKRKEQEHV